MSADVEVRFLMEGKHTQGPGNWDTIGSHPTEEQARHDEREYRNWNDGRTNKGWSDFRVVKVTTIREVLQPPTKGQA